MKKSNDKNKKPFKTKNEKTKKQKEEKEKDIFEDVLMDSRIEGYNIDLEESVMEGKWSRFNIDEYVRK